MEATSEIHCMQCNVKEILGQLALLSYDNYLRRLQYDI